MVYLYESCHGLTLRQPDAPWVFLVPEAHITAGRFFEDARRVAAGAVYTDEVMPYAELRGPRTVAIWYGDDDAGSIVPTRLAQRYLGLPTLELVPE